MRRRSTLAGLAAAVLVVASCSEPAPEVASPIVESSPIVTAHTPDPAPVAEGFSYADVRASAIAKISPDCASSDYAAVYLPAAPHCEQFVNVMDFHASGVIVMFEETYVHADAWLQSSSEYAESFTTPSEWVELQQQTYGDLTAGQVAELKPWVPEVLASPVDECVDLPAKDFITAQDMVESWSLEGHVLVNRDVTYVTSVQCLNSFDMNWWSWTDGDVVSLGLTAYAGQWRPEPGQVLIVFTFPGDIQDATSPYEGNALVWDWYVRELRVSVAGFDEDVVNNLSPVMPWQLREREPEGQADGGLG